MAPVRYLGFMPAKKYRVALTQEERQQLEKVARSNRRSIREKTRARILLLADTNCPAPDGGQKDEAIAKQLRCASRTVSKVRQRASVVRSPPSNTKNKNEAKRAHSMAGKRHILLP